jgi:hypothetical protein
MADVAAVASAFKVLNVSPIAVRARAGFPAIVELNRNTAVLDAGKLSIGGNCPWFRTSTGNSPNASAFVDNIMRKGGLVIGHASMGAACDKDAALKLVDSLKRLTCGVWTAAIHTSSNAWSDNTDDPALQFKTVVDTCQYGHLRKASVGVVFSSAGMQADFSPHAQVCGCIECERMASVDEFCLPAQLATVIADTMRKEAERFAHMVADHMERQCSADPALNTSIVLSSVYKKDGQDLLHRDLMFVCGRLWIVGMDPHMVVKSKETTRVLGVADMRKVRVRQFKSHRPTRWCMSLSDVKDLIRESPESLMLSCVSDWDKWYERKDPEDYVFVRPLAPGQLTFYEPHVQLHSQKERVKVIKAADGDTRGMQFIVEGISCLVCNGPQEYTRKYMTVSELQGANLTRVQAYLRSLAAPA